MLTTMAPCQPKQVTHQNRHHMSGQKRQHVIPEQAPCLVRGLPCGPVVERALYHGKSVIQRKCW
jgi:hypothetical protein